VKEYLADLNLVVPPVVEEVTISADAGTKAASIVKLSLKQYTVGSTVRVRVRIRVSVKLASQSPSGAVASEKFAPQRRPCGDPLPVQLSPG